MKPLSIGHKRVLFKQVEFFLKMLISTSSLGSQKQEKNYLMLRFMARAKLWMP